MPVKMYNHRVCVIVNAMSTGAYLAPTFISFGYQCVHVRSLQERNKAFDLSFPGEFFIEDIGYDNNLDEVMEKLSKYRIAFVVAGAENGVELADLLSVKLQMTTSNGLERSAERRDKTLMSKVLKDHGLNYPEFKECKTIEELMAWANQHNRWPIVLKPPRSAGTQGVCICKDKEELAEGFKAILTQPNLFGQSSAATLAQEYLIGNEYMVNAVSAFKTHRIIEIWHSKKKEQFSAPVYDFVKLLDTTDPVYEVIEEYVTKILDALQINFGPSHSEVVITERGPVLIESAARLQGNVDPSCVAQATGTSHIHQTVMSYLNPELFLEGTAQKSRLKKFCMSVSLISQKAGILQKDLPWEKIESLKSFHTLQRRVKPGDRIKPTVDLFSTIGGVYLLHELDEQIISDYHAIRAMEADFFYNTVVSI